MRAIAWVLLACGLVAVPSVGYGDTGFLDRTVTVGGVVHRYQVYVPVEWTRARSWPIVVYLHGNGFQGVDGSRHMASAALAALTAAVRANRTALPAVIVFPQAEPEKKWTSPGMPQMVRDELDSAMKEFNGDPNRLYLMGMSMGGGGTLRLAARWPERFAALVSIAGHTVSRSDTDEDREADEFLKATDPFIALATKIQRMPIWLFHSDSDETASIEQARRQV